MISKVLFEGADAIESSTVLPENIGTLMQSPPQCEAACLLLSNTPSADHCRLIDFNVEEIVETPQPPSPPIETVLIDAVNLIAGAMTVAAASTCRAANGNGTDIVLHLEKI